MESLSAIIIIIIIIIIIVVVVVVVVFVVAVVDITRHLCKDQSPYGKQRLGLVEFLFG